MKKFYYLSSVLAIFILAFISCEKDLIESEKVINFPDNPRVSGTFNIPEAICAGEPAEFCFSAPIGTNLQVQQWDDNLNDWVQVYHNAKSDYNPECFLLQFDASGDYSLRYKMGPGRFTQTTISVENCDDCDESFSYLDNDDETYTFTYIPGEDMESALVVFTFAQSVAVTGFDETWSNNGQTMQKEMDLVACAVYTWTVTMTKDCNGSTPNNNVWTDFKVDNISKKNLDTPNIVYPCD